MGYSATSYRSDTITIDKADLPAMIVALRKAEADSGINHISWCDPMEVIETKHDNDALVVMEVLSHYGFEDVELTDAGDITIGYWGGDKIGSSWTAMWEALGSVVKHDVKWVMIGEDHVIWGEAIIPGIGHVSFNIDIDGAIDAALKLI